MPKYIDVTPTWEEWTNTLFFLINNHPNPVEAFNDMFTDIQKMAKQADLANRIIEGEK